MKDLTINLGVFSWSLSCLTTNGVACLFLEQKLTIFSDLLYLFLNGMEQ